MSSSSGIIKQSKSRKRYEFKDKVLKCYYKMHVKKAGAKTASEIADVLLKEGKINVFEVGNVQKRVSELKSEKLGYISCKEERLCGITNTHARAYVITQRGIDYLQKHGFVTSDDTHESMSTAHSRSSLSNIRHALQ